MQATALDLRYHTKELLDKVQSGESVSITHRGKTVANLVPIIPDSYSDYTMPAFGMWALREDLADPTTYVRNLRKARF